MNSSTYGLNYEFVHLWTNINSSTCGLFIQSILIGWTHPLMDLIISKHPYRMNLSICGNTTNSPSCDELIHFMDLLINLSTLWTNNKSSSWNELVHIKDSSTLWTSNNSSSWNELVHFKYLLINSSTLWTNNNSSSWNELVHLKDLIIFCRKTY